MKRKLKKVTAVLGMLLVGALLTVSATAECGGGLQGGKADKLRPQSSQGGSVGSPSLSLVSASDDPIVGFWKVTLTAEGNAGIPDGTIIDQGFTQWHSDGTEILNSSRNPATGNFCLGVWKKADSGLYKLNHFAMGWDANNTNVGLVHVRENIALRPNRASFGGTFALTQFDQSGNTLAHITGKVTGIRITVDTPASRVF